MVVSSSTSVLFITDPLKTLNIPTDSSLALARSAKNHFGFAVFHCKSDDLSIVEGELVVRAFRFDPETLEVESESLISAKNFDYIFLRKDPPFNLEYLTITYLLEQIDRSKTLILNEPVSVRNNPEKLFIFSFPQFIAETIVTSNKLEGEKFLNRHEKIIMKPLFDHGGINVLKATSGEANFSFLFDNLMRLNYGCPIMLQRFMEKVTLGDKRILILDGEFLACYARIPAPGSILAGMRHGASYSKSDLSNKEKEMIATIGPELKKLGLYFVGMDVIDDHLTEINSTSPTGLAKLQELYNIDYTQRCWKAFFNIKTRINEPLI